MNTAPVQLCTFTSVSVGPGVLDWYVLRNRWKLDNTVYVQGVNVAPFPF